MITLVQLEQLSRKFKTNTTVVAREYLQLVFLQSFYENLGSEKVFFKGGTAIHFLLEGFRFSEDLDFTSEISTELVGSLVEKTVAKMQEIVFSLKLKEKKSLAGKTFLLTLEKGMINFPIFVRLDFSFREKTLQKERAIIKSDFPVIFTSFVHFIGGEEMLAEKIRALLTRHKGRDLYDSWFLMTKGYQIKEDYVRKKMAYYPKVDFSWEAVLEKVENYEFSKFKNDLLPFISQDQRTKIDELFEIVKAEVVRATEGKHD